MTPHLKLAKHSSQAGFTLLEIIVATSITVIMMIAASNLFLATLRSNGKDTQVTTIKADGDYALGQMEFLLRNALLLVPNPITPAAPICANNMSNITLKSLDGGVTTLGTTNNLVSSKSATAALPEYLTTTGTTLSNLHFDCSQAGNNYGTYVTISFTLTKNEANANQLNPISQNFQTSVVIRSY